MRVRTFLLCLGCALLLALPVFSQGIPTGTLSGRVSADNQTLPGVTVSVSSPNLQGKRSATTNSNGDYTIPLLPPGDYQASFEIEGFQPAQRSIKVNAAQTADLNVTLSLAGVAETIEVVGNYETISSSSEAQSTYSKTFIEGLPMERNVRETVLLNAGVNDNGPAGAITIAGAQSYESLFLVNGVVVNENLRGQPLNLFIEDAIEETTTSVSGISAEYGRFAGGVVNTITKSGGNELSGSFRTNFTNDKWTSTVSPIFNAAGREIPQAKRLDKINKRYEGTLGGWVVKDRLWYFLAARQFKTSFSAQTALTAIPFSQDDKELRSEGKLTFSPFEGHRLVGSYIKIDRDNNGNVFGSVLDLASVDNRKLPQDLKAINYTGVLSDNFFLEGQFSRRYFAFVGSGSDFTDIIKGTWIQDQNTGVRYNSPTFCGVCGDETRSNENYLAKASWFLSTGSLGSHDVAFGYDSFNDKRKSNNFQSGSNLSVFATDTIIQNGVPFPVFAADTSTWIVYWPVLNASKGTNFKTNSLFANDRWRLNNKWSFNLGVRYDQNDGKDAEGKKISDDSKISPRLGLSYDLKGDGDWIFNLSAGEYVTAIANTQGDASSSAGVPAIFGWFYFGPEVNTGSGPLVPTATALQTLFTWFNSTGGVNGNTEDLFFVDIPGATTIIPKSLQSPYAREISAGVSKRLGNRGVVRVDLVDRKFGDFYSSRVDLGTGQVNTSSGPADRGFLLNEDSDILERTYRGLLTQFQYRLSDRLNFGAVYTLSKTEGNVTGETSGSGPVSSGVREYPQYKQASWNSPKGYLGTDQRHRAKVWGVWDLFKTDHNHLSLGFIESFQTGVPYGAVGSVASTNFVTNPGYALPPSTVTYYYTARDAFRTDDITATDLTLNYAWTWNAFSKNVEIFIQPEVLNVFNERGLTGPNNTIRDNTTTRCSATNPICATRPFNPFTTTPVEGTIVNGVPTANGNWAKGPNFGKATAAGAYQTPRTYRFSVGFRF